MQKQVVALIPKLEAILKAKCQCDMKPKEVTALDAEIAAATNAALDAYAAESKKYDDETDHGSNETAQQKWAADTAKALGLPPPVPPTGTDGTFPTFDGDGWGVGGYAAARFYLQSGWFIGPEGGAMALRVNGTNPDGAFSKIRWMAYEGGQVGYSFNTPGTTPINVYVGAAASQAGYTVGIDTRGIFDSMDKTLNGWSAHTGIEVQPAPLSVPNFWVGFDYRYSYWRGTIGDDAVSGGVHFFSATASYQFAAGH
jgi:hypothetical protein